MQVNEGLKAGDLEGVVNKRFSVDQFKSKMGDDKNIMVLAFTVDGLAPANSKICSEAFNLSFNKL